MNTSMKQKIILFLAKHFTIRFSISQLCDYLVHHFRDILWYLADFGYCVFHDATGPYLLMGRCVS